MTLLIIFFCILAVVMTGATALLIGLLMSLQDLRRGWRDDFEIHQSATERRFTTHNKGLQEHDAAIALIQRRQAAKT